MKKLLCLDEDDSVVGSISDPDDKIASDLSVKSSSTYNRIATGIISATRPDHINSNIFKTKNYYQPHLDQILLSGQS